MTGYKIFPRNQNYRDNFDRIFRKKLSMKTMLKAMQQVEQHIENSCALCGCPIDGGIKICDSCKIELRNEEHKLWRATYISKPTSCIIKNITE